jgi:sugar/nucleoside kinase (ribokinase family)
MKIQLVPSAECSILTPMTRSQIARDTARLLREAVPSRFPVLLGFDGFVDDIIEVVSDRPPAASYGQYHRIDTLTDFAARIASTTGHGTNFELVVKRQKLGGQGPIMGNALNLLGLPLTYVGAVGDGAGIHPVFRDWASRCNLISVADAARTHALEFSDGKLMMGELEPLSQITFPRLLECVGRKRLIDLCREAKLLGLLNWTMLPHATAIWRSFALEVVPQLRDPPRIFVDLADPKKRSNTDLAEAMGVLSQFEALHSPVTLSLNEAESWQVASALRLSLMGRRDDSKSDVIAKPVSIASAIRDELRLDTVVVHSTARAVAANAAGTAIFDGPYVKNPTILTGGGDHFNAGFAFGQLHHAKLENALCLGSAMSGFYVRHAESPSSAALAEFLEMLPEPQSA